MKKKYWIIGLVVVLLSFFAWKHFSTPKQEAKEYEIFKVVRKEAGGYIEAKGKVDVNSTISVFVDKPLKVKEIFVKEGDYVEKGKILMTFDDLSRNKLIRSIEKERLDLQKLRRNYKVEVSLQKIGGASLNSLKDMQEEIRGHELNLEGLEEDFKKTASEIASPVSGTISSLTAQENYLVDTNNPLLKIADLSNVKIILEIPEYNVRYLKLGEKLTIRPEIFEEKESFPGEIVRIGKIAKVSASTSENILEVEVKPLEQIPYIVPGFKVSARIHLGSEISGKQLLIPKTSMLEENGKFYVFVVKEDESIVKQEVEVKILSGKEVAVLKGLEENTRIVRTPDVTLKDGDKVIDSNTKGE